MTYPFLRTLCAARWFFLLFGFVPQSHLGFLQDFPLICSCLLVRKRQETQRCSCWTTFVGDCRNAGNLDGPDSPESIRRFVRSAWFSRILANRVPSDTKLLLTKNYSKIIIFEKLRISRVISRKSLSFLEILKVQIHSKITKNNSQGIIFAIISCQRVNREVQTVNWEAGKKGAVETGVKRGLKKAHKPWIRG